MNGVQTVDSVLAIKSNENYLFRLIEEGDYYKGYFELLAQLTVAEKCEFSAWKEKLQEITKIGNMDIVVIEHKQTKKVVGSITLIYEPKFIRGLGYVCHIEDFVIDENHRKSRLGTVMLEISQSISQIKKCYKIILDCADKVQGFYEKFGFDARSKGMALYLNK